jgi:hypothetical protein
MRKLIFLIPIVFTFIVSNKLFAQKIEEQSWITSIYINTLLTSSNCDWSLSHPIFSQGGGVQYETITGTFEQSIAVNGGLEMSKGYFGFQCNFEFMPQKLTKSEPIKNSELNLFIGEFSILLYLLKDRNKSFKPYLSLGGGFLKANGDIDNTGIGISYGTGCRIPLSTKFDINLGLKGMLLKYTQLNLTESISKDISINLFKLSIGIFYQL